MKNQINDVLNLHAGKTESKHTPGPWTYIYSGTCLDLKGNNGNTLIAEFPTLAKEDGTAYRPSEEDAANLELIRSAPDMLAALKWAVAVLTHPVQFAENEASHILRHDAACVVNHLNSVIRHAAIASAEKGDKP